MRSLLTSILLITSYVITSCGSSVRSTDPISTPAILDQLQQRLTALHPSLLTCEGGYTDALPNTITSRVGCDNGDSIAPMGLLSLVDSGLNIKQYLLDSIGTDGRPYRSPEHRKACEGTPSVTHATGCDFSRDHFLGILFYSASSMDSSVLELVLGYMDAHNDRICADPSYAQCGLTPAIWDVLGDTQDYIGMKRSIKTYVPNIITQISSDITIVNSEAGSFQLSLVAEVLHLKLITGRLNASLLPIIDKLIDKSPNNLYFHYLRMITHPVSNTDELASALIELLDQRVARGNVSDTVWAWAWPDEPENANGWSYFWLGKLLLQVKK